MFLNWDPSEILTLKQHKEILKELKTQCPELTGFDCLLMLYGENLSQDNLQNH